MDKIFYDIKNIRKDCRKIVSELKTFKNFEPDVIIGIARGGAIPATYIAYMLNKPLLTLSIQTYDNMQKKDNINRYSIYSNINNFILINNLKKKKLLFIDDIVDTGETLNYLKNSFKNKEKKNLQFASLYISESTPEKFYPDIYLYIKLKDSWVIFPWEYV